MLSQIIDSGVNELKVSNTRWYICSDRANQSTGKPDWRLYKAQQRQRQKDAAEAKKKNQRQRKSKERLKTRQVIPQQMAKKRALDSVRKSLPYSPRKKVALVESPLTRKALEQLGHVRSPEDEDHTRMATAALTLWWRGSRISFHMARWRISYQNNALLTLPTQFYTKNKLGM